tara:strand:- start:393 stop:620 length:228 start_codon:yes stop_codon:yes gene_type:complete
MNGRRPNSSASFSQQTIPAPSWVRQIISWRPEAHTARAAGVMTYLRTLVLRLLIGIDQRLFERKAGGRLRSETGS